MNQNANRTSAITIIAVILGIGLTFSMAQEYVGPEKCLTCHNNASLGDATGWRTSMHANGYSVVLDDAKSMQNLYGIVADYDENGVDDFKDGLDFNSISTVFDPFKPNAPILGYSAADGYTITIGEVTSRVYLTYGGSGLYKQRYVMKIKTDAGVSADHYVSPIQYNEKTHEYALYHANDYWVYDTNGDPTNTPIFTNASTLADIATNSRSLTKGCSGCHTTGLVVNAKDANGEWTMSGAGVADESAYANYNNIYDIDGDGDLDQINTGCERCHGPGGDHASSGDKTKIVNPANLTADEANNLCGMCHSRGKSLPDHTFSFPFDDANMTSWSVGDMVFDYYSNGGGYYGDGTHQHEKRNSKKHHQQFFDFYESAKPTFMYHQVRCFECHDVHNEVKHHMREEVVEEDSLGVELVIATENDNNTLCLACHATHGEFEALTKEMIADPVTNADAIAAVVTEHTNHNYDPAATGESRCSKCHMPKTIKSAIRYDIHAHTFEPISPQKTLEYGMPSACAASCHRGIENGSTPLFNTGADASIADWTEAADVALAEKLKTYFGPSGTWWQVDQILAIVESVDGPVPEKFHLAQNFPNPFNPRTTIPLRISMEGNVKVILLNLLGQEIETLMDQNMGPGEYRLLVNAESLPSGVYFYQMTVAGTDGKTFTQQRKMVVMK